MMEQNTKDITIRTILSKDYVPNWGLYEALRELVQNTIDSDGTIKVRKSSDQNTKTVWVMKSDAVIPRKALAMGNSAKRGDNQKLGEHGEGMKLAMLIYAREGKTLNINTGTEKWRGHMTYSASLDCEVLDIAVTRRVADITNTEIYAEVPDDIDMEELYLGFKHPELMGKDCMFAHCHKEALDPECPDITGRLYVGGLMVSSINSKWSYNLHKLPLTRDREVADTALLYPMIVDTVNKACIESPDLAKEMAEAFYKEDSELENFAFVSWFAKRPNKVLQAACWSYFLARHRGKKACRGSSYHSGYAGVGGLMAKGLGDKCETAPGNDDILERDHIDELLNLSYHCRYYLAQGLYMTKTLFPGIDKVHVEDDILHMTMAEAKEDKARRTENFEERKKQQYVVKYAVA